jgi:hypothetical protein
MFNTHLLWLLGNSGKPVTLETSRLMKFVMQVFRSKELAKISKSRTRGGLESRTLEASESRMRDGLKSWTCEASKSRICKDLKPWTCGATNFGNLWNSRIWWRTSSGVTVREDFLNGQIHKLARNKVKVVVSKRPGLACELVAGL